MQSGSSSSVFVSLIIMSNIIRMCIVGGVIESLDNFRNEAKDTERLALELLEAERYRLEALTLQAKNVVPTSELSLSTRMKAYRGRRSIASVGK